MYITCTDICIDLNVDMCQQEIVQICGIDVCVDMCIDMCVGIKLDGGKIDATLGLDKMGLDPSTVHNNLDDATPSKNGS